MVYYIGRHDGSLYKEIKMSLGLITQTHSTPQGNSVKGYQLHNQNINIILVVK